MATLAKDFHRLMKRIDRLSDHQARIENVNWDDDTLDKFTVVIKPNASYYKGGTFKFRVTVPNTYPSETPPAIWCETDIYHPNIDNTDEAVDDSSTNVCCNIFDTGTWNPKFGLDGVVLGLIFLMHNPNYSDPLQPLYFEDSPDEQQFAANVHRYMTGQDVDGYSFTIDFAIPDNDNSADIDQPDTEVGEESEAELDTNANNGTDGSLNENSESGSACAAVNESVKADFEMTEEMMLKILNERDDQLYTSFVDKSVAELAEVATNHMQSYAVTNNAVGDDCNEEDSIDLRFVDGDFVIVYADSNMNIGESVTVTETSCAKEGDNSSTTSVIGAQDIIVHTALTQEEYMLQLLYERDVILYTEYVNKSVAELNPPPVRTNHYTSHNDTQLHATASQNNPSVSTTDMYNMEMAGATSHNANSNNDGDSSASRIIPKLFERSVSAPHAHTGDRDTGYLRSSSCNMDTFVDASLKTFTYLLDLYNKWH